MLKKLLFIHCLSLITLLSFSQEKPNVLLIMVDDMNDWVSAFS